MDRQQSTDAGRSVAAPGPRWQPTDDDLVLTHTVDGPRELVWRAWTEGERLARWFGPKGYEMFSVNMELAPGGAFHYGMHSPDGTDSWGKWVFEEIEPPERLVFVSSASDADGRVLSHPGLSDFPVEVLGELRLDEEGERTRMTLRSHPIGASEAGHALFKNSHPMMQGGWKGTFEQLDAYLAGAQAGSAS